MKLKSLGLQTQLIMDNQTSQITENKSFIVCKTPERADYFWGNYLIMKSPPKKGDYKSWIQTYENEFCKIKDQGFCVILFDTIDGREAYLQDFIDNDFNVGEAKILTCTEIIKPKQVNEDLKIKAYSSDEDWNDYIDVHFTPNWDYGSDSDQKIFLKQNSDEFKSFSDTGIAQRYGAFLNGKMIADLGVYWENGVARFNNIATHRDHRRKGACRKLVYEVCKLLLERDDINTLVMEADEHYHAAKIYESVGFMPHQRLISLEWSDPKKFA